MAIKPYTVNWSAEQQSEVLRRVSDYTMPQIPAGESWEAGCDAAYLARLREHWLQFDWDKAVERLNRHPQFTATIDGLDIHYVHVRAEQENAPALMLLHGWPSSPFEFFGVIDRLANPSRYGGDPADSMEIIAPSMPGYGFGAKPDAIIGPRVIADHFNRLMVEVLGHERYYSHGGDWGAVITTMLAQRHTEHVPAIHLGMIFLPPPQQPSTPEEREWVARFRQTEREMGGYNHLQSSKPMSLAWLAAGNPMGQAAWLAERYHDWSDLRTRSFEEVFELDWLLTAILVHVMNDAFASAANLYAGLARETEGGITTLGDGKPFATPTAFTNHRGDPRIVPPIREKAEQVYNIVRWRDSEEGGHFPAHEQPDEFVADITEWMRMAVKAS